MNRTTQGKRGGGSLKRRKSSEPTKRRSRGRHAPARGELMKRPLVCRFHEGELPANKSCVGGIECSAVSIATTLEHRVHAIWGLAEGAYEGAVSGVNGVRADHAARMMSFAAAFEAIKVLARSINDDMMEKVSPDERLDKPALQFLGNFGLIGEWPSWNNRLQLRNPSKAILSDTSAGRKQITA